MADPSSSKAAAEAWFVDQGLPWFVTSRRDAAHAALRSKRTLIAVIAIALVGVIAGVAVAWLTSDLSLAPGLTITFVVVAVTLYLIRACRAGPILKWAARRTLSSLRLILPMVTRGLPLLLLFITFLFINAEVWMLGASLDGGVLWVTVLLFVACATGFLLVRLPEELSRVDGDDRSAQVHGLEKANLILVLLVAQGLQVLLLALTVFGFFVAFGAIAINQHVQESWTGAPVTALPYASNLSVELLQVSIFLAGFSGLYFAVTAVTEETYRDQFFTMIKKQLERAVEVRATYRAGTTSQTE